MKQTANAFKYEVKNVAANTVDIHIDGYIVDASTQEMYAEWFGDDTSVSYKSFRNSIPDNVHTINLFVNSGGGHVGDAMAIHDYLVELESKGVTVNREGRGIVASAATYLVMGKNSTMASNSLFMIHEVSSGGYGTLTEMKKVLDMMQKFNDLACNAYCEETGLSKTVVNNLMTAETWMTADEAVAKGFVKAKSGATITNAIPKNSWPFQNAAMWNVYNSLNSNQNDMEANQKLADVINEGFKSLRNLFTGDKANTEATNAINAFAENLTAATTAASAEHATAITNALATFRDSDELKTIIENAAKAAIPANLVTTEQLTEAETRINKAALNAIGGKPRTGGEETTLPATTNKSKFAGKAAQYANA